MSCSINLFANNPQYSSTGEVEPEDSVLINYDDLRVVNSKLIELDYEKQLNAKLRSVVINDSIAMANYATLNENLKLQCKRERRARNIGFGAGIFGTILAVIVAIVK